MLVSTLSEMQQWSDDVRRSGKTIGVIPTMGYLHDGHRSLIETAAHECDRVVTTVFVNPLQFGAGEDFARYPRDLERDIQLAHRAGTHVVFAPSGDDMYPVGYATTVDVGPIGEKFEGAFRPGHFRGVATVVAKLFHLTKPHVAYFGQKDYQQTLVIARLIADLNFDIRLRVLPTVREPDGLAMSSRNVYLQPDDRRKASIIYRTLRAAEQSILDGQRSRQRINAVMYETLASAGDLRIDYAAAARAETLDEPEEFFSGDSVVLLVAVRIGSTRLIDNLLVRVP